MRLRPALGGIALAFTPGFNVSNVGAVATHASHAYGVRLWVIGLFTTALFVSHAAMQVPAGRLSDRYGPRLVGGAGLATVAVMSACALTWREAWFAILLRLLAGVGTACAFVAGSEYMRATSGTAVAQGIFGAASMVGGGLALALVPLWGTWQAPFATAAIVAAVGVLLILFAPATEARPAGPRVFPSVRDRRLLPLGAMHAASFGLSVVVGNWVVTLLERAGHESSHLAGVVGALILFLGVITRPLGGRFYGDVGVVRASLVLGGAGVALLCVARPVPIAVLATAAAGLAAGIPFAWAFSGAARLRPDAPGAAVGLVNMVAAVTILVGTPLLGLTFSLPGDGRIGFAVVAALWAATALAVRRESQAMSSTSASSAF
ncbi:MAG TPA: MFS transporter [Gaiellaceae bacterium]|nr:MFS transporter [Gaiellaceae bacterium]